MPVLTSDRLPKYRKHKASGQAIVTLNGRDHYLGPHGTQASKREYDRLTTEWLANGRQRPAAGSDLTIVELLARFRRWAVRHYQKDGKPTREVGNLDDSVRPLKVFYGRELVRDFGPQRLKTLQAVMVHGYTDTKGKAFKGLCRGVINNRIGRIKHVFKWAVSEELAPASIAHALATVPGLQYGRTEARETTPVKPVSEQDVEAVLPYLPAVVADMVRLQKLTGARPGEVCLIRPCDITRTGDVWLYRPASHKTQHHGRERLIFIGPRAQAVLRPYLLREATTHCFSPQESERQRKRQLRERRKSPVQPSQVDRRLRHPRRTPADAYEVHAYARALARACQKAGIAKWHLHQLRHTAATEIRRQFGLEAAQVALGHARADTTQIYAERDFSLAAQVMLKIG